MAETGIASGAVAMLDADGSLSGWVGFDEAVGTAAGHRVTTARAAHGPWEVRALRVDAEAGTVVPGVRVSGWTLRGEAQWVFRTTRVEQGIDVCAPAAGVAAEDDEAGTAEDGEVHSELRILVPYDAVLAVEHRASESGGAVAVPHVTVRDVPVGYPVIVAVRRSAEPPYVPQLRNELVDENGKRVKIHRTGSATPQVTLEMAGGGHEVAIKWPDRSEEKLLLPAPRAATPRAAAPRGLFRRKGGSA